MTHMIILQPGRPPTDPTDPLKEALVAFEKVLTEEQRRRYRNTTSPDASSVITFVAEVDDNNQSRARRCVAPRMCTFLDAAQQFTGVINTFVSSNPVLAALVWGSVKTAIVAASNVASYFDKVTSMVMQIGRHSPIYTQFGHLYPGSTGLQRSLCEYWAHIVRLCIKIIGSSQKTILAQTWSAVFVSFEIEFKPFLNNLKEATENVNLHISLASKQAAYEQTKLAEYDSKENQKDRTLALKFRSEVSEEQWKAQEWRVREAARRISRMKSKIRDSFSTIDYLKTWKQALRPRAPRTAEWVQQEQNFQDWVHNDKTSVLWCPGTLGVGKTVIVSAIIAHLYQSRRPNDIICYHFCKSEDRSSLSARTILGTLGRQMLDLKIEHANEDELQRLKTESEDLEAEGIVGLILSQLEDDKIYYIIVDGIDESEGNEMRIFAKQMSRIRQERATGLKFLCTSRPEIGTELFRGIPIDYKIPIKKNRVDQDIERYIEVTLDQCLDDGRLVLGDQNLKSLMSEVLKEESDGMFLWTRLFIDEICAKENDNDILHALTCPPKGISNLLDLKFARVVGNAAPEQAINILKYCGVLKRPLTLEEFKELLAISVGQQSFDRASLPNDVYRLVAACCGLVHIDEEYETLHYVHHSIESYLFTNKNLLPRGFRKQDLDVDIGCLCMTYLDFNDFKRQLMRQSKHADTIIDPIQISTTAVLGSPKATRIVQKVLQYRQRTQRLTTSELERKTQEALGDSESSRQKLELQRREFFLLEYARTYWIYHLVNMDETDDPRIWSLLRRCLVGTDLPYKPWYSDLDIGSDHIPRITDKDEKYPMLGWLVANGGTAIVLVIITKIPEFQSQNIKREALFRIINKNDDELLSMILRRIEFDQGTLNEALLSAAREGRSRAGKSLLQTGATVNSSNTSKQIEATPFGAKQKGPLEVVKTLLKAEADVGATNTDGRTALSLAASSGHLEVVKTLLKAGADVSITNRYKRTALFYAVFSGHLEVVKTLLEAGADISTTDEHGRTAFSYAVSSGHLKIAKALLEAGADISTADEHGRAMFSHATSSSHLEVAKALLEAEADVSTTNRYKRAVLFSAVSSGYLDVVKTLLKAGADVGAATTNGRTALSLAASSGHLEVAKALLEAGADISTADEHGRTPFSYAVSSGHLEVAKALLEAGADVSTTNGYKRTALFLAASSGYLDVVKTLLKAGADVGATNTDGRTALSLAASSGHLEVVKTLLKADADISATDEYGRTALFFAVSSGHLEVVETLLGVATNRRTLSTYQWKRAMKEAEMKGHNEVVDLLHAHQIQLNPKP